MIVLALLVPALMMGLLVAMDAFEEHLFPRPTAADDVSPPAETSLRAVTDSAAAMSKQSGGRTACPDSDEVTGNRPL